MLPLDEVYGCMNEFREEWESVSKIAVIAHEGNTITFTPMYSCWGVCAVVNMAKEKQWEDDRLFLFDLQTVEFTYMSVRIIFHLSCNICLHMPPGTGLYTLHLL